MLRVCRTRCGGYDSTAERTGVDVLEDRPLDADAAGAPEEVAGWAAAMLAAGRAGAGDMLPSIDSEGFISASSRFVFCRADDVLLAMEAATFGTLSPTSPCCIPVIGTGVASLGVDLESMALPT